MSAYDKNTAVWSILDNYYWLIFKNKTTLQVTLSMVQRYDIETYSDYQTHEDKFRGLRYLRRSVNILENHWKVLTSTK